MKNLMMLCAFGFSYIGFCFKIRNIKNCGITVVPRSVVELELIVAGVVDAVDTILSCLPYLF